MLGCETHHRMFNKMINSANEKYRIECACKVDNRLYFFTSAYNSLNYYDFEEEKRELLGVVPWEPIDGKSLYYYIFSYRQKLVLIPFKGEYIAIFDLKEKKFYRNEKKGAYTGACLHGRSIYLAPMQSALLLKFDIEKNTLESVENTDIEPNNKDRSVCDISFFGNKLFWGLCNATAFYSFDIIEKKRVKFDLRERVDKIRSVKVCGEYIIVTDFASPRAILLNADGKLVKEYILDITFEKEEEKYHRVLNIGNKIVVRYIYSDSFFCIDLTGVAETKGIVKCEKKTVGEGECIVDGTRILILPCPERPFLKYEDGQEFEMDLSIPKQIVNMECNAKYVMNEKMISLREYLEALEN